MTIKRKDFQKAAAFIHEFLLKLQDDSECAELRDSLNLALLHMQKYYRVLQHRNHEKSLATSLTLTARGLSPMTPFVDAPDKFQYKWINLDSVRLKASIGMDDSVNIIQLPPIIQAAKNGSVEEIAQLIHEDPACSDDQDGLGRTALTYAVHYQQMSALHCLLENEANPNLTAHDGSTAIHQACHDSNSMALSMLLQYGGDFTIPDTHGRAPIHWAVTTPNADCLQLLIQHHADVNIRDKDGLSPIMWACRLDHIHHFEILSQSENFHVEDADGIERDLIGRTWMHWSVRRLEPLECLQTLLTTETAGIKDDEGRTVLLTAAELGSLAACRIILEIGGKHCINDQDNQSRNALHLATIGGHGDVCNFLLENGVDLSAVDKFNATAWDYAKNRQLHYCQLIIMSHQRQRLVSNPTSPIPTGLGLMLNGFGGSFMNGDFKSIDFDNMSTRGSIDSQPITPPHPPKRPRTTRMPVRRSRSLNSNDRAGMGSYSDRGPIISREQSIESQSMDRRNINSAGGEMFPRGNERIEVSVNTHKMDGYEREEVAMATDDHGDHEKDDEDIDGVSVGGMDVSDIDDDDDQAPKTSRGPPPRRGPPPQQQSMGPPNLRSQQAPGPKPSFQPRYPPRPPAQSQFTPAMQAPYRRSADFSEDSQKFDLGAKPPLRSPNPPPGATRGPGYYNRSPSPNPGESYPPPNRPRPAPRPPRMQPSPPKPQPRRTPSPQNRPGSGPSARDQLTSPPSGQTGDQSTKDNRPDSAGRPPGIEGKKILPPPMLMPLENAPKPPPLHKHEKIRKKKKKRRERLGMEKEEVDRETDVRSPPEPPENLTPPRGFAAPLHPPPSATRQRGQSGIPSPKYSKGAPQKHESSRYIEESMEDESKDDSLSTEDKPQPPMVNGLAVPIREAPARSAKAGGKRQQPMESEEYEMNGVSNSADRLLNDNAVSEDDVGPLIPPPQGFRGPSARPPGGRPLSQSVPQDSRSNSARMSSGKPPLPRGRGSASSATRYKHPSPPRRPSRPPTGRQESQ